MIEKIQISNIAAFGAAPEQLNDLKEINFIYGSNATGKTTISRVIADIDSYSDCSVVWRHGAEMERFVYNRDFVERNFSQSNKLKGIFTLGVKDKETLENIASANTELKNIKEDITQLKVTLNGASGDGGKKAELSDLEKDFEEKCWNLKQTHDTRLWGAFTGVRNAKHKFKSKLLEESESNSSFSIPLTALEEKAETIYVHGETPQQVELLNVPFLDSLLAHETNSILNKKVIGKSDVDIGALIEKIGNSDWVKQGREFYDPDYRVCPFCQQSTSPSLEVSLNHYFDETFARDVGVIDKLCMDYETDAERVQQSVQMLLDDSSNFLNVEKLQAESNLFDSIIRVNTQRLEDKRRESSRVIELDSLKNVLATVTSLVHEANAAIERHNRMVSNLTYERTTLAGQVWRYLLDHEIGAELSTFNRKRMELDKAISNLSSKIEEKTIEQQTNRQHIRSLEKDTTSIQPTIDDINTLLTSFGFTGFTLIKSEHDRFYEIRRPDGSDAKQTLSEGEQSFITFLYFYHLLKGSENESGMTSDRVVVFDDPVSSLDSDILFIVSSLIKVVYDEIRSGSGTIRQVFVLTHNVYFHKEVSFNSKRCADKRLKDETFWMVRKSNQESKIIHFDTNPIKTSYELLWMEVRNPHGENLAIQNTLRRILESYFKILGNVSTDEIYAKFEGNEKVTCRSLFSWVNDGSHSTYDSLYVSIDDSMVKSYLSVFKQIFEKSGHIAHYNMMMGEETSPKVADAHEAV